MSLPTLRRVQDRGISPNMVAFATFIHIAVLVAVMMPHIPVLEPEGVAIELVQSDGAVSSPRSATEHAASGPPPTPEPPTPEPPTPVTRPGPAPMPEPADEPIIRRTYAATANLIVRDEASSVTTTGDDRLPPPLAGHRNQSPAYPAEAERRRLEGEVHVLIRVRPDGSTAAVDLAGSSGIPMLDRAAIDTLLTWRFAPGRVAASYPFNIRFVLGEHR